MSNDACWTRLILRGVRQLRLVGDLVTLHPAPYRAVPAAATRARTGAIKYVLLGCISRDAVADQIGRLIRGHRRKVPATAALFLIAHRGHLAVTAPIECTTCDVTHQWSRRNLKARSIRLI